MGGETHRVKETVGDRQKDIETENADSGLSVRHMATE